MGGENPYLVEGGRGRGLSFFIYEKKKWRGGEVGKRIRVSPRKKEKRGGERRGREWSGN